MKANQPVEKTRSIQQAMNDAAKVSAGEQSPLN